MKMFSDCSGSCYTCAIDNGCIAGHGDDDYTPATKEQIQTRIKKELDLIENIGDKRSSDIRADDLCNLRYASKKLRAYCKALANGKW